VDLGLHYDDSGLWNDSMLWSGAGFHGLQPTLTLARELKNQADEPDNPPRSHRGTYLGLGVQPSFCVATLCQDDGGCAPIPVTIRLPANVGLSLAHYYEDRNGESDTFGFADVGAFVSLPLNFVPKRYGRWRF